MAVVITTEYTPITIFFLYRLLFCWLLFTFARAMHALKKPFHLKYTYMVCVYCVFIGVREKWQLKAFVNQFYDIIIITISQKKLFELLVWSFASMIHANFYTLFYFILFFIAKSLATFSYKLRLLRNDLINFFGS